MVGNWINQRSERKIKNKREVDQFNAELSQAEARLATLHTAERDQLDAAHPSVSECVTQIAQLGELLWSRRPEHPEFLQVRLGRGDIAPVTKVENSTASGLATFVEQRDALAARFETLKDAPVVADLRSVGGLGVSGHGGLAEGVALSLIHI